MPVCTRDSPVPSSAHPDVQVGLLGGPPDFADALRGSSPCSQPRIRSSAAAAASMSSGVPTEIRRHSASSGAPETSRTRMPSSSNSRRKTSRAGSPAAPDEDEVGGAGKDRQPANGPHPDGQMHPGSPRSRACARPVPPVSKRRGRRRERHHVHVIRQFALGQLAGHRRVGECQAEPEPGHAQRLGEGAQHHQP